MFTGKLEMKLRSQVIQRFLPRPPDTNIVLRPLNSEPPLTDLQKVILCHVKEKVVNYFYFHCVG